ncbi:MAG TPA: aminodeoxychorismate/anthranilate synthase component II [Chthoniobacterales bacterium]|jgi:anthranilate synthase/aminodeoxychorismate synthase-like glutamine amidotransferase|nr:aminodeoxychorismate/anthranilate synthase component II [Chthoniobacterales bacterium]
MKLLIIDNYDSFTYNLVQLFGEMDKVDLVVKRNDEISVDEIKKLHPDRICISPGPGRPENAGVSSDLIRELGPNVPILGVCLGHQCIAQVFGGKIVRADKLMHGKTSQIHHERRGVFKDLAEPLEATRYHSLIVKRETVPESLKITAETDDGEIMGLQHRQFPIHGVQFHPESILTTEGRKLLANFLHL